MINAPRPIIGICAFSGTGKTTLLTQVIPYLQAQGLKLAIIKHAHHTLELDTPGKDSYKLREAGAEQVILTSYKRTALMQECHTDIEEPSLQKALEFVRLDCADLIIVEGFKHEAFPKIELHRPSLGKPLLYPDDSHIIAVATDTSLGDSSAQPTQLDINQPEQIAQFILDEIMSGKRLIKPTSETEIKVANSCADDFDPDSLTLHSAQQRIIELITPLQHVIKRPLREALGQVVAEDIISPINVPSHTNSAMDGYALVGADLPTDRIQNFEIIGTALAGKALQQACKSGQCVRIMTGAPMPEGTDTVVMQEHVEILGSKAHIGTGHKTGQNVRQAGEDIREQQIVLRKGHKITPADLGLLASLGLAEVKILRRPRVAFFSTGDELRSLGETLDAGCVYDSNRYTLYGMLTTMGMDVLDMGVVRDNPAELEQAFLSAANNADVIITSGGVSVGEADFTKQILSKLGEINFWKIAMKPGRPLAYGKINDAVFFGLPGNPVAVMVTFEHLVKQALLKLSGQHPSPALQLMAILQEPLRKKPGRAEYPRGILTQDANGQFKVEKAGMQGSGILTSMSHANCYIVLSEQQQNLKAGDTVLVQPFQ